MSETMTIDTAMKILSGMYRIKNDPETKSNYEKENRALDFGIAALKQIKRNGEDIEIHKT